MELSKKEAKISLFEPVTQLIQLQEKKKEKFKILYNSRHNATYNIHQCLIKVRELKGLKLALKILTTDYDYYPF